MFNVDPGSPLLFALEPMTALFNYMSGQLQRRDLTLQGDGHPVLVFPGFSLNGSSTVDLRVRLQELGYAVHDWKQGFNYGPGLDFDLWLSLLSQQLQEIHAHQQCSVSLIGFSLGGTYARELAKLHPQLVRQVITLGTPFANPGLGEVEKIYGKLTGAQFLMDEALFQRLGVAPPVPSSSIYSRTDGFVGWESCIEKQSPCHRNIEVKGVSHLGMVHHPDVLKTIASLLIGPDLND
ncbi:alpha/beta hydrolase [soil metagenome]